MNSRERFNRTLSFAPVDHGFSYEIGAWGQTIDRWRQEGFPDDVETGSYFGTWLAGNEYFGIERVGFLPLAPCQMLPPYREEVIEEDERTVTRRHADGRVERPA